MNIAGYETYGLACPLHNLLAFLSDQLRVTRYLEVGVNEGGSLSVVVKHSEYLNHVFLFDNWLGTYGGTARGSHEHIDLLLNEFKFMGKRYFYDGNSSDNLPIMSANQADLALVDGDHSADGCWNDMKIVIEIVRPGGLMVVDDLWHPDHQELKNVVMRFEREHPACLRINSDQLTIDGIAVFVRL